MSSVQAEHPPPVFEAFIVPHRSLTPRGLTVLISLLMGLLGLVVLRFWLLGAWPVVLCSLLEVPMVILLLIINIRSAKASELIMLNSQDLTVVRTDPAGRRTTFCLPAAWLRVDHEVTKGTSRVILRCHGNSREIGTFLHEPEKQSLSLALSKALHEVRHPRFDNVQLRDNAS